MKLQRLLQTLNAGCYMICIGRFGHASATQICSRDREYYLTKIFGCGGERTSSYMTEKGHYLIMVDRCGNVTEVMPLTKPESRMWIMDVVGRRA